MSGLQKLCKMYGRIKVGSIIYVWDYVEDRAIPKREMTKERFAESEKIRWETLKKETEK
jgi:hypothetical protein